MVADEILARLQPLGEWLLLLAGAGVTIALVVQTVTWGWDLVRDLMTSDAEWDRQARAAGYKDNADRARDHW